MRLDKMSEEELSELLCQLSDVVPDDYLLIMGKRVMLLNLDNGHAIAGTRNVADSLKRIYLAEVKHGSGMA